MKIGGSSGCETADFGEDVVVESEARGSSTSLPIITLQYDGTPNTYEALYIHCTTSFGRFPRLHQAVREKRGRSPSSLRMTSFRFAPEEYVEH